MTRIMIPWSHEQSFLDARPTCNIRAFFWYSASALYEFCHPNFWISLPPPLFYKRKKLKYVPLEHVPQNAQYKYKMPSPNIEKKLTAPQGVPKRSPTSVLTGPCVA